MKINENLANRIGNTTTEFVGHMRSALNGQGYCETAAVMGSIFRIMLDKLNEEERKEVLRYVNEGRTPGPEIAISQPRSIVL